MTVRVVILARYPLAGQCKTRLIPALGPEGAAAMHHKLTELTVRRVQDSGLTWELWGTSADQKAFEDWLGPHKHHQQASGDLGERLEAAGEPYPVLFLGTDCPDLAPSDLIDAAAALDRGSFVLGPAHDGGYWTLGMPRSEPSLFSDMPWGTEDVFEVTRTRMKAAGIDPLLLATRHDLDRPEDLERWPELLP